jgi:hypothetical protein
LVRTFAVACLFFSFCAFAQVVSPDFSIVVLPDAQYYSQSYPQIFTAQTQWIAQNRTQYNIQFVIGEGDIVNIAESSQWQNADAAIRVLDNAQIPYVLAIGNHDYDGELPVNRSATGFNNYFGPARYAAYSWYQGNYPSGSNENFYTVFNVNGQSYLVLALEFIPRDEALTWAKSVLDANPDKEVIVVTHSFMWIDSTRADQCNNDDLGPQGNNQGEDVWRRLLNQYANVSLVLSGHFTSATASRRADLGVNQNLVNQIFANYQSLSHGGDGWLRIMTFHPATNLIDVLTYSPYLNQYKSDSENQFSIAWHNQGLPANSTGTISGVLRAGRLAPNACAFIGGGSISAGGITVKSARNGAFSLPLPTGSYNVQATAAGWASSAEQEGAYPGYPSSTKFFMQRGGSSSGSGTSSGSSTGSCTASSVNRTVTICSPTDDATVDSPVSVLAQASDLPPSAPVTYSRIYVDGVNTYQVAGGSVNTSLTLATGEHRITVQSTDAAGVFKSTIYVTVK